MTVLLDDADRPVLLIKSRQLPFIHVAKIGCAPLGSLKY